MKKPSVIAAGLMTLCAVLTVFAAEEIKLDGIKCVMNPKGAARADQSVAYRGGKVFFCCENCPKSFDAKKNATAANHQLAATRQAKQAKCPLTGEPINPDFKLAVSGVDVSFCCPDCKSQVEGATGESQLKMVFANEAFDKAFTIEKK
jgi:hypothetical protein